MRNCQHNFEEVRNYDAHDNHDLTEDSFGTFKVNGRDLINEKRSHGHIIPDNDPLDDSEYQKQVNIVDLYNAWDNHSTNTAHNKYFPTSRNKYFRLASFIMRRASPEPIAPPKGKHPMSQPKVEL